jgi:putative transposase
MLKATKIRIYPTTEQAEFLNRQFGAVRFALLLQHRPSHHVAPLQAPRSVIERQARLLPIAKKSGKYGWLKEADSVALAQTCINLDRAFQRFFDSKQKAAYPKFKSKRGKQSSYHCMSVSVGDKGVKVPKLDPIKAKVHQPARGKLKSITLSRTVTGKYYASLLYETEQVAPPRIKDLHTSQVVGLDRGLSHLVIDSAGRKLANRRFIKKAQKNLKRKQQALSRKMKGSAKRAKARLFVAKAHEWVANACNDFQHKLSRGIISCMPAQNGRHAIERSVVVRMAGGAIPRPRHQRGAEHQASRHFKGRRAVGLCPSRLA